MAALCRSDWTDRGPVWDGDSWDQGHIVLDGGPKCWFPYIEVEGEYSIQTFLAFNVAFAKLLCFLKHALNITDYITVKEVSKV